MRLKSDKELYRRRRRIPWGHIFVLLVFLAAGGYLAYYLFFIRTDSSIAPSRTPTPMPTPTPSALSLIADAEDAYWDGDLGAAITAYQAALDMEPNHTELYLELSRLLTFKGRPERGLEMAREALSRQPENAMAWALLGLAYDWLGVPLEAIAACEKAVALDPMLPEGYAYLAEAYMDAGQWFNANDIIDTALALGENNVDVLRNYGYILENQGNYFGAIEAYRDALALQNQLAYLHLSVGRNANALGNLNQALEAYEAAAEVDPSSAAALDRLGWTYLLIGEYERATQALEQALEIDPTSEDAYGHLGTLYFQQRNYEGAINMLQPALRYGEAKPRRRTVFFVITQEDTNNVGDAPQGREMARAALVHPKDFEAPLRGQIQGEGITEQVQGRIRMDVMSGSYQFTLRGIPPVSAGKVYIGWFLPLYSPEGLLIRTEPIFPTPEGRVERKGETGATKGPPIENYYVLALSHYLLDECDQAMPYIEIALRIDPNDANVLQTLSLCQ